MEGNDVGIDWIRDGEEDDDDDGVFVIESECELEIEEEGEDSFIFLLLFFGFSFTLTLPSERDAFLFRVFFSLLVGESLIKMECFDVRRCAGVVHVIIQSSSIELETSISFSSPSLKIASPFSSSS
jgi:hypothetical protein